MHQFASRGLVALNGCRVLCRVALAQYQTSRVPSPGHCVFSGLRQSTQRPGGIIVRVLRAPAAVAMDCVSGSRQLGQGLCGGGTVLTLMMEEGGVGEDPCWNEGRFSLGSEPIPGRTI